MNKLIAIAAAIIVSAIYVPAMFTTIATVSQTINVAIATF